jgi:hypothetical protein
MIELDIDTGAIEPVALEPQALSALGRWTSILHLI